MDHVVFVSSTHGYHAKGEAGYHTHRHVDLVVREGEVGRVDVER